MKKICSLFAFTIIGLTVISGCETSENVPTESDNIIKFTQSDNSNTNNVEESTYTSVPNVSTEDICYKVNEDGKTATIISQNNSTGKISIPETIDGYNITAIDEYAFYEAELTEIILPDTIETIGSGAFYNCSNLENISLPNSLISIESFAFAECINLKSIDIPTSTQNIDNFAFINCLNLSYVKIELKNAFAQTAFLNCPGSPIKYDGNFKDASLNWHTVEVPDGYTYSDWITESSFESEELMETSGDDTERILSDGYYVTFDEESKSKIINKYIIQRRDKEPKYKEQQEVTYNYTISVEENGGIIDKKYYNQFSIPSEEDIQ